MHEFSNYSSSKVFWEEEYSTDDLVVISFGGGFLSSNFDVLFQNGRALDIHELFERILNFSEESSVVEKYAEKEVSLRVPTLTRVSICVTLKLNCY